MATQTLSQAKRNVTQASPTVDRQQASKLLGVSVRSIDRYIKGGKLPAYQKNGRIWLKRSDILDMARGELVVKTPGITENHSPIRGTGARTAPSVQEINAALQSAQPSESNEVLFYKDLYEEAQKRLNEYQRKSEQSSNRMSELEAQILRLTAQTNTIASINAVVPQRTSEPVDSRESRFEVEMLKKDLTEKDKEISALHDAVEKEKNNKNVFAIITYTLLALQPVFWYFLR